MAVSNTAVNAVPKSGLRASFDVIASADADTTATIAHGLGVVPDMVTLEPLLASAYTSQWTVTSRDATNVTLTKGTAVGSGNAAAQVRVHIVKLHSIQE